jgi:hypothetical protein
LRLRLALRRLPCNLSRSDKICSSALAIQSAGLCLFSRTGPVDGLEVPRGVLAPKHHERHCPAHDIWSIRPDMGGTTQRSFTATSL